ncbi:hypothetical protein GEMRC1_012991 [Eukaryota sp. GEM-RC1]
MYEEFIGSPPDRFFVSIAIHLLLLLPLSCTKSLESLKYVSSCAILVVFALTFRVMYLFVLMFLQEDISEIFKGLRLFEFGNFFIGLGIFSFAFAIHVGGLALYHELDNKSVGKMLQISKFSFLFTIILLSTLGISGFIVFGDKLDSNILSNLDPSLWITKLLNLGVSLLVIASYPLLLHCAKESLMSLLFPSLRSTSTSFDQPTANPTAFIGSVHQRGSARTDSPMSSAFLSDVSGFVVDIDEEEEVVVEEKKKRF